MSQLVFQTPAGGSTTITAFNATINTNFVLPSANGTLLYQDTSNNAQLINIVATGTTTLSDSVFSPTNNLVFGGTGQITIPVGNTSQRSASPTAGMIRFNTNTNQFEGYSLAWGQLGGGATGGGGDTVFVENGTTVTTSYTLTTSKNAESVGPISINSGATITVPSGQRWVVL